MRRFVEALCRLMLRVFFRRVDAVGPENVPAQGPLLIVANHPNGLMDPLLMLSLSPRPVSFMAKEPLFRMPLVGAMVRGLDCLPVYRKKDGADTSANRRTMEAARAILGRGGNIGIFPEGISHDLPRLQPLKTGAARMALSAQRLIYDAETGAPLRIQPVGLFYEDKATFRSEAVIVWGKPLEVPLVALDAEAEPARDDAQALTARIADALRALSPDAPDARRVALAARLSRLLAAIEVEEGEHRLLPGMGDRLLLMQRLLAGYRGAEACAPGRLAAVLARIDAHERDLTYWGLAPDHPAQFGARALVRSLSGTLLRMTLLAPLALLGILANYPAYRLIGWLAHRFYARDNDVVSTAKALGGLVLFPLTWGLWALWAGFIWGSLWGLVVLLASPACAWVALHFVEHLDALASARRSLRVRLSGKDRADALLAERRAIRDELVAIEASLGAQSLMR